jgi:hypothetical protein
MWQQADDGRVTHPFEPVVLGATLALIPVLIVEYDVSSGGWLTVAKIANWVIWGIFAAELAFILYVAPRKQAALRAHWLDAAIVVVSVPLYGKLLSSLRSIRLFRLLRLLRAGVVIGRALQAERRLSSVWGAKISVLPANRQFLGGRTEFWHPTRISASPRVDTRPPKPEAGERSNWRTAKQLPGTTKLSVTNLQR